MELRDFVAAAATTDRYGPDELELGLRTALYGIAGEAGSVVSEAKKWFRAGGPPEGLGPQVSEELGDLLWYMAAVCRRLNLDLDTVAANALAKNHLIWTETLPPLPHYDEHYPDEQQLLRRFEVRFVEDEGPGYPVVRVEPLGAFGERYRAWAARKHLGDPLNDNAIQDDGYRYHDVIHIAHATVLGWSPVLRQISGSKRKQDPNIDRIQDRARAVAIEEGLSAFVFNYVEPEGFLVGRSHLDWELLKHIRRVVGGLEVASQPPVAWQRAYLQGFAVFRQLLANGGGTVRADMDERTIIYSATQ
jgi:hypothetical protein